MKNVMASHQPVHMERAQAASAVSQDLSSWRIPANLSLSAINEISRELDSGQPAQIIGALSFLINSPSVPPGLVRPLVKLHSKLSSAGARAASAAGATKHLLALSKEVSVPVLIDELTIQNPLRQGAALSALFYVLCEKSLTFLPDPDKGRLRDALKPLTGNPQFSMYGQCLADLSAACGKPS